MESDGRSPHTPLEPRKGGTFNFSPSVKTPNCRRTFTPLHNSKSPMISPILAGPQPNTLHPMAAEQANDILFFPDVIIKMGTPSPRPASTSRGRTSRTGGQSVGVLPSAPVHNAPGHAHLNEHLTVLNVLDDIHMEHLGPIFEREEIDMNIFSIMSSSDLESIGIVGADQEAVLAAIKKLSK